MKSTLVSDIQALEAGPEVFDLTTTHQLQRLAASVMEADPTYGKKLEKIGTGASMYLGLAQASMMYFQSKDKLIISTRADKVTSRTLETLAACKGANLRFFTNKGVAHETASLLFSPDESLIEQCSKSIVDMVEFASSKWDAELQKLMVAAMEQVSGQLQSALEKLPVIDFSSSSDGDLKPYQAAVSDTKISDLAAAVQKRLDACKHFCKLGKIDISFLDSYLSLAKQGLAAVASLSIQLLVQSPTWANVNSDTIKMDGKEQKLLKSLQANQSFVETQQLELSAGILANMSEKLAFATRPKQ